MDIISYENFYKLKLEDFISNKEDLETLDNWEFMNDIWQGESFGFSEWLQLSEETKEKSISLDLNDLSDASIDKISSTLKLNLTKGMTKENVVKLFGHPMNIESFVSDRLTLEYIIGSTEKYYLSLTITDEEGLTYFVLMNHLATIADLDQKSASPKTLATLFERIK